MSTAANTVICTLLRRTRRQMVWAALLNYLWMAAIYTATAALAFVIYDHNFLPDVPGRMLAALIVFAPPMLMVLYGLHRWSDRRLSDMYIASELERGTPQLKNALITAVQATHSGESLSSALVDQIMATQPRVRPLSHSRKYRLYWCIALLALVGLYARSTPQSISRSLTRLVLPGSRGALPTRTQLVTITPAHHSTIVVADSWFITARTASEPPTSGFIRYRTAELKWQKVVMSQLRPHQYIATMPPLFGKLEYQVHLGDAQSRVHQLNIVPEPVIETHQLTYRYPSYLQLPQRTSSIPGVDAVAGTEINLRIETEPPLVRAVLVWNDQLFPMHVTDRVAHLRPSQRLEWSPHRRQHYHIQMWASRDASPTHSPDYPIVVRPDRPPTVSLISPLDDVEAHPTSSIPFAFTADDDFGIEQLELQIHFFGTSEAEILSKPVPCPPAIRQLNGEIDLRLTSLRRPASYHRTVVKTTPNTGVDDRVGAGDRLVCYFRIRDNCPTNNPVYSKSVAIRVRPANNTLPVSHITQPPDANSTPQSNEPEPATELTANQRQMDDPPSAPTTTDMPLPLDRSRARPETEQNDTASDEMTTRDDFALTTSTESQTADSQDNDQRSETDITDDDRSAQPKRPLDDADEPETSESADSTALAQGDDNTSSSPSDEPVAADNAPSDNPPTARDKSASNNAGKSPPTNASTSTAKPQSKPSAASTRTASSRRPSKQSSTPDARQSATAATRGGAAQSQGGKPGSSHLNQPERRRPRDQQHALRGGGIDHATTPLRQQHNGNQPSQASHRPLAANAGERATVPPGIAFDHDRQPALTSRSNESGGALSATRQQRKIAASGPPLADLSGPQNARVPVRRADAARGAPVDEHATLEQFGRQSITMTQEQYETARTTRQVQETFEFESKISDDERDLIENFKAALDRIYGAKNDARTRQAQ